MDENILIVFTPQETIALRNLIHLAVQARGMEVAETGVVLVKKIDAAVEQANKPSEPKPTSKKGKKEPA